MEALFNKYDRDRDGLLSKMEVERFARSEYKFVIPEEALSRMWRNMVEDGQRGVPLDRFQWLRMTIGTAREMQRDLKRREERIEKESVLASMKADLQERIREAVKAVDEADKDLGKCEKQVQPLNAKAKTMPAPDMLALADETDAGIKEAKVSVVAARKQIDVLSEGIDERFAVELRSFLGAETKTLEIRMGRMDSRLSRVMNLSSRFREQASKKRGAELERLRSLALRVIRYNQRAKGLDKHELFKSFDTNGDGEIDQDEFIAWFSEADKEIKDLDAPPPAPAAAAAAADGGGADAAEGAEGDADGDAAG